ncbi:MAG TPA: hypothetical protein VNV88_04535 [Candidatus Solibacter sp.]|jgi:hypothetical protein|nr:hypothetical protein [Candidatus Solibacter sp.]
MSRFPGILISGILATLLVGCGGSSSSAPQSNVVTVTFSGTPQSVATQVGSGAFTSATLQSGNPLTLVLPQGTTKYAVAWVCPLFNEEFVIEATLQDATAFTAVCRETQPALGIATGSANASLIAGATNMRVVGGNGFGNFVAGTSGPFNVSLPVGTDDVAVVALDSTGITPVGVKIVRSQSIPGAIGSGSTVLFGPEDATTVQTATVNNLPAGFPSPGVFAQYHTANGTIFPLTLPNNTSLTYRAVPAAASLQGDFYQYSISTGDPVNFKQRIGATQTTSSSGPVTMALPAPWSYSGPVPDAFPTFTFNYSGFSGLPAVGQQAAIQWALKPTKQRFLIVMATANFQAGATTLTIPNLTSLSGFFAPPPSGTPISWLANIFGATSQEFIFQASMFSANPPASGSLSFVQNTGSYIQP